VIIVCTTYVLNARREREEGMKRRIGWLSVALIVLICGAVPLFAGGKQEKEQAEDTYAIEVWKFGGTRIERAYGATKTKAWNEAHPEMLVKWVENDWSARVEKVVTNLSTKTLPDVIIVDTQSIPDFAAMGAIQALSDIDSSLVDKWSKRFVPETFKLGYYKGKFYGFSTYVDIATFLAYNTKMVRKAGLVGADGEAKAPETWEDMVLYCQKLQAAGYTGVALSCTSNVNDMNMVEGIAYANGGRWLDAAGKPAINGPGFVDTLKLYQAIGPYALPGSVESNYRDNAVQFFNGQAAMYIGLSWLGVWNTELQVPSDFSYSATVFPLNPRPTGRFEPASGIMSGTFCPMITTNAKNVKAAMAYIDYWTEDAQLLAWNGSVQFGRVPTGIVCWNSSDIERFWPDLKQRYDEGALFRGVLPMPAFPGLNEGHEYLSSAVQEVVLGVSEPQVALDKAASLLGEALSKK
jgi:multiple sugar transport system substrate-binding protein